MVIPAFVAWAVIPFGPEVRIPFTDTVTPLQLTDMPVAVLFILAVASIGIYGIVLAGWSSGSTYSLLGGMRSSAQMISYEVAMGLALVAVFMYAGSVSTSEIVAAQADIWYAFILVPSFVIYVIAMVGETNRAPFDLPEAEGELVGGFHTEYSSLKFALFFLAEYVNMATVSAVATTLFLGGWRAPWPISIWDGANEGYWPLLWFFGKVIFFISIFVWLRGTLPRLRYDQFMVFGWKRLIPIALAWIVAVAGIRVLTLEGGIDRSYLLAAIGVVAVLLLVLFFVGGDQEEMAEADRASPRPTDEEFDAFAGGYPVPPMPGQSCRAVAPVTHPTRPSPRPRPRRLDADPERAVLGPDRGVRSHLPDDLPQGGHRGLPQGQEAHGPAVPRPAPAEPLARRPGEVHRLRAVRLGVPCRRDLRRGRLQHRGRAVLARVSAMAASTRSTTCAASCAACASRPAPPGRSR